MHHIKPAICVFTALICFLLCSASCSAERGFRDADRYFEGLDALRLGDKTAAIRAFTKSKTQDSQTASLLATEELLALLYEKEDYSAILDITGIPALVYDAEFFDKETTKTDDSDLPPSYEIDPNLLSRYRLLAMIQTNHPKTIDYITDWAKVYVFSTSSQIYTLSREHILFFESDDFETFAEQNLNQQDDLFAQTLDLIAFRVALYKTNYSDALKVGQSEVDDFSEVDEDLGVNDDIESISSAIFENHVALLLSDIGKSLLYGSKNRIHYAQLLEEAAESYPNGSDEAFMCHFYAARIYDFDSLASYRYRALQQFKAAMDEAKTPERYDNALWYYLRTVNKTSSRSAISALQEFAPQWNDPYYFDDFLSTIAFRLLSAENWKGFYAIYEELRPHMSDESVSKYAYISGRLIEEGFLYTEFSIDADDKSDDDVVRVAKKAQDAAFETAFNASDGSSYYRIMAAEKLGFSSSKLLNTLLQRENELPSAYDEELEYILAEYIERGYAQNVYPLYIENSASISFEVAIELSTGLAKANNPSVENGFQNNFYPESLRIVARILNQAGNDISKTHMELLYPRFYTDYVVQMAELYDLREYVLYALIRSESFFDHDAQSWAGATGLTQLISGTAGDVARKLKVEDYDLHDAEINIAFGAFYLNELIPRVDNSMLRALFSYNAGITNVRRWVSKYPELSLIPDLFLEIIPFSETREYGRKILSAATMYGILYYDKTTSEVIAEIMQ